MFLFLSMHLVAVTGATLATLLLVSILQVAWAAPTCSTNGNVLTSSGNIITSPQSPPPVACDGTQGDDVMSVDTFDKAYGLGGNDMISGAGKNELFGGSGNDILVAGTDNNIIDGAQNDDMLLGSTGNDIMIGGSGNDKLFAGNGVTLMIGGPGADHFDCGPLTGTDKTVVLDYNALEGDTISGNCKVVNNVRENNLGIPRIDTG
jgi:Ca2+-binding RTX toxin-like protein